MQLSREKQIVITAAVLLAAAGVMASLAVVRLAKHTTVRSDAGEKKAEVLSLASLIRGSVVYQRESSNLLESIYRTDIGSSDCILLARNGKYPRWSPDGTKIAFLREGNVMLMNKDGSDLRVLAPKADSRAIAFHPNGREILFTSTTELRAVNIETLETRPLAEDKWFVGMDIDRSERKLLVATRGRFVWTATLPDGKLAKITPGCSVSLSPDGEFFLHNNGGHSRLTVRHWGDNSIAREIKAPEGFQIDNVKWSNHPDWIAVRSEGKGAENIYLYHIPLDRYYQVTFCGDANRPDLFVENSKNSTKGE